jgi:hydroxyacylglutathione hydrolase
MYFRQLLNEQSACASYLLGCKTHSKFAVVDPHVDLVDEYIALAGAQGMPIVAAFDTHVQADHVSGLPELVRRTGATAYLPAGAGVNFEHHPLADGEVVKLGNTEIEAIATPGHARAHHGYTVTDRTRGDDPWFVLTGDALLVGDAGRPDLHAHSGQTVEEMARLLYRSLTERLMSLPDHLLLYPSHYSGSVCGRGLSANPASSIGFERRNNPMLLLGSEEAFVEALIQEIPPAPPQAEAIVAANRSGRPVAAVP